MYSVPVVVPIVCGDVFVVAKEETAGDLASVVLLLSRGWDCSVFSSRCHACVVCDM